MADTLFTKLQQTTKLIRKVALRPGQVVQYHDPNTGMLRERTEPLAACGALTFEIHNLTGDEALVADAKITAVPPPIYQKQESPSGRGDVEVLVGHDDQSPVYLKELRKQQPTKDAVICLYGCPALMESTPGETVDQKAEALIKNLPGGLVGWLADQIDTLQMLTAVGEEEVARFLSNGSKGRSASSSSTRSQTHGKNNSKKKRTARTSPTKKPKSPKHGDI